MRRQLHRVFINSACSQSLHATQMQFSPGPEDLRSRMQWTDVLHKRCEACNKVVVLNMTLASQRLDGSRTGTMALLGKEQPLADNHEEPSYGYRHSQDEDNLDRSCDDFCRRLSDDEPETTYFPDTYFQRMSGVELDRMKDAHDSMFPLDKRWPFLLRVPANIFGVSMGIGSQAVVWKDLSTQMSMHFLRVPSTVGTVVWVIGIVVLFFASLVYALKICFWPKAVHREFVHPVRSNFLIAPFLSALFLLLGAPTSLHGGDKNSTLVLAFVLCVPVLVIEVHFYGHWLMGGQSHRLSAIVNPTTQISVIGNFIGATAFAVAGWQDLGLFLFSAGLLHQIVVFLTIYMRLPSNTPLSSQLHPVLFLFVAPPSTAATAWIAISGHVDYLSKILTFIGLFLYLILLSRANHLVRGVRFSLAWWAYTFPMGSAALAAMAYANANHTLFVKILAVGLSFLSSAAVMFVLAFSMTRALTGQLFPNDEVVGVSLKPDLSAWDEVSHCSKPCTVSC